MFMYAIRASRRQVVAVVFCVVLLIIMLVMAFRPARTTATSAGIKAGDNTKRIAYLNRLGYEVDDTYEVREVQIPDTFDDTFTAYNTLQQQAGMDFSPYHGKRVKYYTYTVVNYGDTRPVQAHLYVYKGHIIGGDIACAEQGGFQKPLIAYDAI